MHLRDCSRVNWEEFVHCQVRANKTYSDAKIQLVREIGMLGMTPRDDAQSPIGMTPSPLIISPLMIIIPCSVRIEFIISSAFGGGGGLVCESVCKLI